MNGSQEGYRARWSPEDRQYVGTVVEFPSLSHLADSPEGALAGIRALVAGVVADLRATGEPVPAPARPWGRTTAHEAAGEVAEALAAGDEEWALRAVWGLAGGLLRTAPDDLPGLTIEAPPLTTNPRFDALIAAVVHHILEEAGVPAPGWVAEPARTVSPPWDVEPVEAFRREAREATPAVFVAHGVYLDAARELPNV